MPKSRLLFVSACLPALFSFAECSSTSPTGPNAGDTGGTTGSGSGGSTSASLGGATGGGGTTVTGKGGVTGGGGATGSGGMPGLGGGPATGGRTGAGGAGGTPGAGGMTGMGGATVDQGGVPLAKAGDQALTSKQYLNLGDMRLINNRWGSDARNCTGTMQKVFVNLDGTLGWDFNRPTCGGAKGDPDFPEVEFGVAPFGTTSTLLTTPAFSSTTLLPIQLKDLTSASVIVDTFSTTFTSPGYWDSNVEFWISRQNPTTTTNAGVYAEIIAFLGYEAGRTNTAQGGWSCDKSGSVTSGGVGYTLCHQSDMWSSPPYWRFFNFNATNAPLSTYSGKFDVKAFIDWVSANYSGFTTDMWLTRIEVGTEIDDNTAGSAKINNMVFEVNGATRAIRLAGK